MKTLVLDLDETLVSTLDYYEEKDENKRKNADIVNSKNKSGLS